MPHIVRRVKDVNPIEITCGIMNELSNKKEFDKLNLRTLLTIPQRLASSLRRPIAV